MEQERKALYPSVIQRVMLGQFNRDDSPQLDYQHLYEAFVQLSRSGAFPTLDAQLNAASIVLSRQRAARG